MSPDVGSTRTAGWHEIRPWTPPLSLSTREVTSVSVTFILSSHLNGEIDPALGLFADEENEGENFGEDHSTSEVSDLRKKSIIADALAKGLSVNVNGSAWQRVFIKIDDAADEAVIIIFGLIPGRQYDVDLGLVHGDSNNNIHRQVITQDAEQEPEPQDEVTDPDSSPSTSSDPPASTPSTSPNSTLPSTPPSSNAPLTVEDRLSQLEHTLTLLNAEREALTASLKSSRRDAQKADAALRSEIDVLKRASEKHVAAENRAKQRMLSLQDALKRAQTATRKTEDLVMEVKETVPGVAKRREEKESEYDKIREEADRVRKERDQLLEKEKKKTESMKTELTGLTNKAEKLNAKKEKMETSTISDLEEQLKEIEKEVDKVEKESSSTFTYPDGQDFSTEDSTSSPVVDAITDPSLVFPYIPVQRTRHQLSAGTVSRPSPTPIQRPQPNEQQPPFAYQPQLWNTNILPRQAPPHSHNPRSSSLQHQQTPVLLTNPHRHSSLKSSTTPSPTISTTTTPPLISASPSASQTTPSPTRTSTLSCMAPAFEPGRPLKTSGVSPVAAGTGPGLSNTQRLGSQPSTSGSRGGISGMGFGGSLKANSNAGQHLPTSWTGTRHPYDDGRG